MDNRTEQIADGLWRVEVGLFCNAYVVAVDGRGDGEGLVVVDCGGRSGGPRIVRSTRMLGFDPHATRAVVLTHWHADHAGSAQAFARSSARPAVHAPAGDLAVVRDGTAPPPPGPGATRLARRVVPRVPRPRPCASALGVVAGQQLPGGLVAVASPGHTAGHLAYWLEERGALLAGDALWTVPRPWLGLKLVMHDPRRARASLADLADLDPAVVAVGHGRPLRDQPAQALLAIAEG